MEFLGDSVLLWAAEHGYLATVQHLYKAGFNINTIDDLGRTPLTLAKLRGQTEVVQYLMDQGADLDQEHSIEKLPQSDLDAGQASEPEATANAEDDISDQPDYDTGSGGAKNSELSETSVEFSDTSSEPQSTNPTSELHNDVAVISTERTALTAWNYNGNVVMKMSSTKRDDDIDSIASLDDDIASQAESRLGGDQYRQVAVDYIAMQFTSQKDLLALYRHSYLHLDEEKFLRNHRRLLKTLFIDLQHAGQKPSEKAAIQFLRSRRRRYHICRTIRHLVSERTSREIVELNAQKDDRNLMLDRYLKESDAREHSATPDSPKIVPKIPTPNEDDADISSDEDSEVSDEDENRADALQALKATAKFLTAGEQFDKYIERVFSFVRPNSQDIDSQLLVPSPLHTEEQTQDINLPNDREGTSTTALQHPKKDSVLIPWNRKPSTLSSSCRHWIRKLVCLARSKVEDDYRRIEWQCDCGVDLYADFHRSQGDRIDKLERSLHNLNKDGYQPLCAGSERGRAKTSMVPGVSIGDHGGYVTSAGYQQEPREGNADAYISQGTPLQHKKKEGTSARENLVEERGEDKQQGENSKENDEPSVDQESMSDSRFLGFLALCVNTNGMYRTLCEIGVSEQSSDAAVFLAMKEQYVAKRRKQSLTRYFVKPATVEFIQFRIWNFKNSYISIQDRPKCMPPQDSIEYRFQPRSLVPPPMPPEVFIHYLEHGEGDLNPNRNDWIDPLPKRIQKHTSGCLGYGVHVIEKPNWIVIGSLTISVVVCGIIFATVWSVQFHDVQGGTGIGALIVACYTALLSTWVYSLERA